MPGSAADLMEAVRLMGLTRRSGKDAHGPVGPNSPQFVPSNDDELWHFIKDRYDIEVSRHKVCADHDAPFEAFANAYFARDEVSLWLGSRGFGGKTFLESLLCFVEETTLGADVVLLGGSQEQALRGHQATQKLWDEPNAPRHLLLDKPTLKRTRLSNGGAINVQAASTTSVRGAHPQRLRIDEADEMEIELVDAAMGQPMESRGIKSQTLFASTHHYPHGTVTELKKRATAKGWRVYTWCYRENVKQTLPNGIKVGWLDQTTVDAARRRVSDEMFRVEYDLQEPSVEGRAISGDAVNAMFNRRFGSFEGTPNEMIEVWCCNEARARWEAAVEAAVAAGDPDADKVDKTPCQSHVYATGVDWGKQRDWTVIATYRMDVSPWWLVAWERTKELPWDVLIKKATDRVARYPGKIAHDRTGIGNVAHDFLGEDVVAKGIVLVGDRRTSLFNQYILAVERGDLDGPRIDSAWYDHYYVTNADLYFGGHPPDSFIAGAMAWSCRDLVYDATLAPYGLSGSSMFGGLGG